MDTMACHPPSQPPDRVSLCVAIAPTQHYSYDIIDNNNYVTMDIILTLGIRHMILLQW